MSKKPPSFSNTKSSLFLLVLALIVGGVGASASGLLNTATGGYLVCVNSTTKVVTHPGISNCPKGSTKLVLGAQGIAGANGLTGAAGISGKDGIDGKDGKTLWNGVRDPENTWGSPGDMFINSNTKILFGPKDLTMGWPAGVSMVGPKGDQGLIGLTGATGPQGPGGGNGPAGALGATGPSALKITELSICGGGGNALCKVGEIGPGGGQIFFVDYYDQFAGFNYLEVAPSSCGASSRAWSSDYSYSPYEAIAWSSRAVGSGQANTTAMMTSRGRYMADTSGAAFYSDSLVCGGKSDWFLGSFGEMKLIYDNLQGLGGFETDYYWSSSQNTTIHAWIQDFDRGTVVVLGKAALLNVRPIRSF